MKVIEEKHNHLGKVYRIVCSNCGSTLEYDKSDIEYDSHYKQIVFCPVCDAMIPHNCEGPYLLKQKSGQNPAQESVQPTPEECEWLPPLDLDELLLSGGINVDQKFMRRDGRIATFVRSECPRGSLEFIMMVEGCLYRYNGNGVRLEYRDGHWCEDDEREADIIFKV